MSQAAIIFNTWSKKLTGLVSVLVVIPSVINLASDIWVSWNDLPIGDKEKTNSALFKQHFRDSPVHTKQIIIDAKGKKILLNLDVYDNGNIFFEYDNQGQWFASSKLNLSSYEFSLISSANAEEVPVKIKETPIAPVTIINEISENNNIVRSKVLSDGSVEKTTLNPNTAETLHFQIIPAPEKGKEKVEIKPVEVITIPEEGSEPVDVIINESKQK